VSAPRIDGAGGYAREEGRRLPGFQRAATRLIPASGSSTNPQDLAETTVDIAFSAQLPLLVARALVSRQRSLIVVCCKQDDMKDVRKAALVAQPPPSVNISTFGR
jgi:hypothetical protein